MSAKKKPGPATGDDTIAAIITPPGEGGIAALRLAGADSKKLLAKFFSPGISTSSSSKAPKRSNMQPFVLRHGHFAGSSGEVIDEVMAVFMPRGKSYTGEDQAEIFCHGGQQVVRLILDALLAGGARAAEPGEFTRLAFLNGRIDLTRAEAVAEVIAANTEQAYQVSREHLLGAYATEVGNLRDQLVMIKAEIEAAIDFSDEEIDPAGTNQLVESISQTFIQLKALLATYSGGRIINEGYKIAIGGRPNAGKSSLFNLMLRSERALVHATAGTTRDFLSEWIDLEGFAVNLIDTAGLRTGGTELEKLGQARGGQIIEKADLLLWMFDISVKGWQTRLQSDLKRIKYKDILLVANKIDLVKSSRSLTADASDAISISCLTGRGSKLLHRTMLEHINRKMPDLTSGIVVTSARHKQKLSLALRECGRVRTMLRKNESLEIVAFTLRQAVTALDEITGKVYTEEILGKIFATFCVGK